MIELPDADKAVFVRGLRDVTEPITVEGTDIALDLKRGEINVVRWSVIRDRVEAGDAELL